MSVLLYWLLIIVAVWLGLSPLVFGISSAISIGVALVVAVFVIFFSIMGIKKKAIYSPWCIIVLGIGLIIWAIASMATGTAGIGIMIDEVIIGLIFVLVAYVVTQLFIFPYISAVDRSGDVLTTINSIKFKGGLIVMNAVLLGSMPQTVIVKPEEIWKMLALVDSSVISHLPGMLYKGWKETKKLVKAGQVEIK